jgi:1-acyl-sn-glycerol-3-phosphate acyltransferase
VRPVPFWFLEICRPGVWGLARALFRIRFHGVEHVPLTGAVVLVPNHVSYMDPVLATIPIHRPLHYMALEPFFRMPGLGILIRWCRAFPVRVDEAGQAARAALRLLHRGEPLLIFPEGGRSPDGTLQRFRAGAFRLALAARAPVVPVTIAGAFEAWPPRYRLPRPRRIAVTYHRALTVADLPASADRKAHPALLAELARQRIASALDPPTGGTSSGTRGCRASSDRPPAPS